MEVEIIKIILAFIVLINPSAALAMFVNFTHGYSYEDKRRVARIASATVFIAIAFFHYLVRSCCVVWASRWGRFELQAVSCYF